jgi:hypothetical protein
MTRKSAEDIMQTFGVFAVIFIRCGIDIGKITATITGNENFATQGFVFFNNQDTMFASSCGYSGN